jgi:hypothetical protein
MPIYKVTLESDWQCGGGHYSYIHSQLTLLIIIIYYVLIVPERFLRSIFREGNLE